MAEPLPPCVHKFFEPHNRPRDIRDEAVFALIKRYRHAIVKNIKIFGENYPERARLLSPEQTVHAALYGAIKAVLLAENSDEIQPRFTSAIKGALQLVSTAEMKRRKEDLLRASARRDVWEAATPILEASNALRKEREVLGKIGESKTLVGKQKAYAAAKFSLPRAPSGVFMNLEAGPGDYFKFPSFDAIAGGHSYQNAYQAVSVALKKLATEELFERKRREEEARGVISEWPFTMEVLKIVRNYFNTRIADRTEEHPAFAHILDVISPAVARVVDNFMQLKGVDSSFRETLLGAAMSKVKRGILNARALDDLKEGVRAQANYAALYAFKKMQDEASGKQPRRRGRPRKQP